MVCIFHFFGLDVYALQVPNVKKFIQFVFNLAKPLIDFIYMRHKYFLLYVLHWGNFVQAQSPNTQKFIYLKLNKISFKRIH